jgi:hypothetical protein
MRAIISRTLEGAKLDTVDAETVLIGEVIEAGTWMSPVRQAAIRGRSSGDAGHNRLIKCASGAQDIATVA